MTKINKEGWEIKKLGEVTDFSRGLTYSGKDEVPTSSNVVLRSNNITLESQSLNLDELKYINDSIVIPTEKKLAKDTIFMCMSNGSMKHIGKVAYIDKDYDYAFGGFMGLMRPKAEVIFPKYLYFYFCSQEFKRVLAKIANGANINNIKFSDINQEKIPLPPHPIQHRIVEELDEINAIISAKKQQLSKLDELAQSIFYNMFGDPVANEKGWEVKTIKEVAKVVSGSTPKTNIKEYWDGPYAWITPAEISDDARIICSTVRTITDEALAHTNLQLLPIGTVLLSSRAPIGKVAISGIEMYCNQGFKNLVCGESVNNTYMAALLRIRKDYLQSLGRGATFKEISKSIVEGIRIQIPPLPLQEAFAARVSTIEEEKAAIAASIEKMQTLLDARMQEYFG